jgi:hypothetical protein
MALVLSFLPNTTYDLPAFGLPFILLSSLPTIKSSKPSKDNTNAIELSAITTGTSTDGFVINGESAGDWSGYSVSSAGDVNGDGLDDLIIVFFAKYNIRFTCT